MRTPITVKIKFKSPSVEDFATRYATDIGETGIFIRTPNPLSAGTALSFEFQLEDASPLMAGTGTVIWVKDQEGDTTTGTSGMGLRFDNLDANGRELIKYIVTQQARENDQSGDGFERLRTRVASDPNLGVPTESSEAALLGDDGLRLDGDLNLDDGSALGDGSEDKTRASFAATGEPEGDRQDRLERILFSNQDEISAPDESGGLAPGAADVAGGAEYSEESGRMSGFDATERANPEASQSDGFPVSLERPPRSAPWGVIAILFILIAGAVGYYFLFGNPLTLPASQDDPLNPATDVEEESLNSSGNNASPQTDPVTIKIDSNPQGAKILLSGEESGKTTPAQLSGLTLDSTINIAFDLPGKKVVRQKLIVSADKRFTAELKEASDRSLRIHSAPEGATVFLNGKPRGKTPFIRKKSLPSKEDLAILVRHSGFQDFKTTLSSDDVGWVRESDDSEVFEIRAKLEPSPTPAARRPNRAVKRARAKRRVRRRRRTPAAISDEVNARQTDAPQQRAPTAPSSAAESTSGAPKTAPTGTERPAKTPPSEKTPPIKLPSWGE